MTQDPTPPTTEAPATRRRRNAAQTRQDLIDVARQRFARDGYAGTTVRDIADEAGVNVALISRYFHSKEGLFEECLNSAVSDVRRDTDADLTGPGGFAARLARRLGDPAGDDRLRTGLLLLIRTSGDERIDEMRRGFLLMLSEKLAVSVGRAPGDEDTLLRAQMLLATVLGIILLRSTTGVQPLSTASAEDLPAPLADLVRALLPAPPGTRPA